MSSANTQQRQPVESMNTFDTNFNVSLKDVPYKFEASTWKCEAVLGLEAAINYLQKISWTELPVMKNSLKIMRLTS